MKWASVLLVGCAASYPQPMPELCPAVCHRAVACIDGLDYDTCVESCGSIARDRELAHTTGFEPNDLRCFANATSCKQIAECE